MERPAGEANPELGGLTRPRTVDPAETRKEDGTRLTPEEVAQKQREYGEAIRAYQDALAKRQATPTRWLLTREIQYTQ